MFYLKIAIFAEVGIETNDLLVVDKNIFLNVHRSWIFLVLLYCVFAAEPACAQGFSVSTNIVEWGNLGTMNIEAGLPIAKHLSIHAGARVNPWLFGETGDMDEKYGVPIEDGRRIFCNKKTSVGLSLRWWPWYVFSGWWFRAKAQYSSYDRGGLFHKTRTLGDAVGLSLGLGYTFFLSHNWNMEIGAAGWGGYTSERYKESMMTPIISEPVWKPFILPDELLLSFVYVF